MNRTASSAAAPASTTDRLHALTKRWWDDHFPGSPVAQSTAAWNHAFAAKKELRRRLASLKEDH
jgi:hypothetical protein